MTASIAQVILLPAMVDLVTYFVAGRRKVRAKTDVKLGSVVFVIAYLWATVRPSDLTMMANWIGVTRDTDLLFYILVLAFVFTTVPSYICSREWELRYTRLARAVALKTAVRPEEEVMISDSQNSSQKDSSMNAEKNAPSDQSTR